MAQCMYCTAATQLFENGLPICVNCAAPRLTKTNKPESNIEVYSTLVEELFNATKQAQFAARDFNARMGDIPSQLPHPDGTLHISHTSRELAAARNRLMTAHNRLNDFLARGIVPEDLKRSAG